MKIITLVLLGILPCTLLFSRNISIVPQPLEVKQGKGEYKLDDKTRILIDAREKSLEVLAKLITQRISSSGGPAIQVAEHIPGKKIKNVIILTIKDADPALGLEGYTLEVSRNSVIIRAVASNGIYYAIQSLFQLFPAEIMSGTPVKYDCVLPVVYIRDMPRYSYRGMHLDVGRHFFPVSFIKKYIDLMSMYKMNTFHWHLTEDQGWRIQIKKYPRLTQIGSTRIGTPKGKSSDLDGIPYGGFYTQDQIRDIVEYARARYITIIPEIEMPGHSVAALTAYPELSCTGGPFEVRTQWGISDDIYCAGNDSTFLFIQDVLSEVLKLFPSTYIHIGGDEAPKIRWENCPRCQERIRNEGLKNEAELQSYFIKRIQKFLNSQGRQLIGWDEILEGGLAPEATVMSWRGIQGGIEAARQQHDVIMTPTDYCYFDYYQGDPETEPLAIGGYLPLKTVYSYEPTPPELDESQAKHIKGAQGNVWTEYLKTPEMVEYMAFPRAIALSEVTWSAVSTRNWDSFLRRLESQFSRLDLLNVNYSKGSFLVDISTIRDSNQHINLVSLTSEKPGYEIRYTTDGSKPTSGSSIYTKPLEIQSTTTFVAALFKEGKLYGSPVERTVWVNLASGKPVKVLRPYGSKYNAGGDQALTDGLTGISIKSGWQGYENADMEVMIDLLNPTPVKRISLSFLQVIDAWILYPIDVEFLTSSDGNTWKEAGKIHTDPLPSRSKADRDFAVELPGTVTRYIKVYARNNGLLPDWHPYKGEQCWIFADELKVE